MRRGKAVVLVVVSLVLRVTSLVLAGIAPSASAQATRRPSVDSSGLEADPSSAFPTISADGRCVAFQSDASNLVPNDANGQTDDFIHEPFLTLEADPPAPASGVTLTFATWTGKLNGAALLVVLGINGTPMFLPAAVGNFDGAGLWTRSGPVPPGLAGTVVTFETLGFVSTGKVDESNAFDVSFQQAGAARGAAAHSIRQNLGISNTTREECDSSSVATVMASSDVASRSGCFRICGTPRASLGD